MKTNAGDFWNLVLGTCLLAATTSAPAATLTVTSTADSGAGSLRAALATAADGDTIDATGLSGSITLLTGELLVSHSITLLGPGPGSLAVSGNFVSRVFHITNAATVVISDLTITDGAVSGSFPGNLGAGLWNDHSTLTLSNCVVAVNQSNSGPAGGVFNDGSSGSATLSLLASTVSGNLGGSGGGGIYNYGPSGAATLAISGCTVSDNNGGSVNGGGVFNDATGGSATIGVTNSTFSGNHVSGNGGALANNAFTGTGLVTVVACTLSGNSAGSFGGGIYNNGATSGHALLTLLATTFSGNSAAIAGGGSLDNFGAGGKVEIGNTILQVSSSLIGNIVNASGTITSDGYNLCGDNGAGLLTGPNDQINTNALLGPLADNGGPTWTCAPLAGSPALDRGKSFGLTADQRGALRPFDFPSLANAPGGDGSDIGAFEAGPPLLAIMPAATNVVLAWPASGPAFRLESVTNLPAGANWSAVNGTSNAFGGRLYLTNAVTAARVSYRLVLP